MPIYAYKCADCGHEKELLQKMGDAPLSDCPSCGQPSMVKQVTAAGFQLKGSGWYVTDFRNKDSGSKTAASDGKTDGKSDGKPDSTPVGTSDSASDTKPAAPSPAPAASAAPAGGAGGGGSSS